MNKYIVAYDLHKPGQDYTDIKKAIEGISQFAWRFQQSVWMIGTNYSAIQVRDHLSRFFDSNDSLMVAGLNGEAAWTGFSSDGTDWFKKVLNAA